MSADLLIGIDFDNTIICYDQVFHRLALESGLIPLDLPAGKNFIRNHLRQTGKEDLWTEMQGLVYGDKIIEAESYPGVDDFLYYCKLKNVPTCIVSHKTRYPYRGPKYDLHEAGYKWLQAKGFLDEEKFGISSHQVYFELTKEEKIQRIASLKCTHFIDDLPEILLAAGIPGNITKILFDPSGDFQNVSDIERKISWFDILAFFKKKLLQSDINIKNTHNNNDHNLVAVAKNFSHEMGFFGDVRLEQLAGGRNNQVFKMMVNDKRFLLKSYFVHEDDPRDRLGNEFSFLRFAWDKGIRCIPQPFIADKKQHVALYEFVQGERLRESDITDDAIGQAIRFVLELNKYKKTDEAINLPLASEACFSISDHINCVERRLSRLCEIEPYDLVRNDAYGFIQGKLKPCWLTMKKNIFEELGNSANAINDVIDDNERCLSPSDFGFHNALLEKNGNLRFIDFEYAGWDDPVKLICDFICQPELPISDTYGLKLMEDVIMSFYQRKSMKQRAEMLLLVHRIKWCCILLNEFRAEDRQRRHHAGLDSEDLLEQQIDKAKQYFTKHLACLV